MLFLIHSRSMALTLLSMLLLALVAGCNKNNAEQTSTVRSVHAVTVSVVVG